MLLAMPFTAKTEEDNFTKLDARRKLGAKKLALHQDAQCARQARLSTWEILRVSWSAHIAHHPGIRAQLFSKLFEFQQSSSKSVCFKLLLLTVGFKRLPMSFPACFKVDKWWGGKGCRTTRIWIEHEWFLEGNQNWSVKGNDKPFHNCWTKLCLFLTRKYADMRLTETKRD